MAKYNKGNNYYNNKCTGNKLKYFLLYNVDHELVHVICSLIDYFIIKQSCS